MSVLTRGRWLQDWHPDNEEFWEGEGKPIARKNLAFSVFAENLGFSIWVLWTIVVLNLANVGIKLTVPQMFWLTAVPNLVGSALRIPYTFAVPRFGGRNWTIVSAALLLIPTVLLSLLVTHPTTPYWMMALVAATGGQPSGLAEQIGEDEED